MPYVLCYSLPYSSEAESLRETGVNLVASKPHWSILFSLTNSTGNIHFLEWVLGPTHAYKANTTAHWTAWLPSFLSWFILSEDQGMPQLFTVLSDGEEETGHRNNMGLIPLSPMRKGGQWEFISVTLMPTAHRMESMAYSNSRANTILLGKACMVQ